MVRNVRLLDFRNYERAEEDFQPGLNVVIGSNGKGKTNLLEALFLLLQGRSFRSGDAKEMVRNGAGSAMIEGVVDDGIEIKIRLVIDGDGGLRGKRRLEGTGAVSFQPDDIWMVKGGPEARRRNLDEAAQALRGGYAGVMREYARVLRQRNESIKEVRRGRQGREAIRHWNPLLLEKGMAVTAERKAVVAGLEAEMTKICEAWGRGRAELRYYSTMVTEGMEAEKGVERMARLEEAEIRRGATLIGPHRDELVLVMGGKNVRRECSQGEQKMAVIIWKLAQASLLEQVTGKKAVLLMDDCLSELDEGNRRAVLGGLEGWRQVVLTTTDETRELDGLAKTFLR